MVAHSSATAAPRVVCLIDHLGPGGAQRQMCLLAVLLKRRGLLPVVVTYAPGAFFVPALEAEGIEVAAARARLPLRRILAVRRLIRDYAPDVVLAFLRTPSLLAQLASLPARPFALVVSERNVYPTESPLRRLVRLALHRLADIVVTNARSTQACLERRAWWLRGRVATIGNGVDLELFSPEPPAGDGRSAVRLAVVECRQDALPRGHSQ